MTRYDTYTRKPNVPAARVRVESINSGKVRVHCKIDDRPWTSQVMDLPAARALRTALEVGGYEVQIQWANGDDQ
ncbi:hypothetical protein [Actinomadura atramentaria]|uniref:hypothetical protein n=1 Tax=Actinomadura atramentaria TaxID=1990 RepID=UPI00039EF260|nr:hypothetical protein [Actinomadura atramentaria]